MEDAEGLEGNRHAGATTTRRRRRPPTAAPPAPARPRSPPPRRPRGRGERITSASGSSRSARVGSKSPPRRSRASARAAAAPPTLGHSTNSATCAMRAGTGMSSPPSSPGQPRPSQRSYAAASAAPTGSDQELLRQSACHPGVVLEDVVQLAAAGEGELEADPETVKRRLPRADQPQARSRSAEGSRLVVVLARFTAMLSPNHLACSWAPEWRPVHQERRVVDRPPLLAPPRGAGRSGTGAARAPSAGRSPDRSRATARPPAPPDERGPLPPLPCRQPNDRGYCGA